MADTTDVTTAVAGCDLVSTEAGEGPAVVVLHHSFGPVGWTTLADDLATDHRVVLVDLPGFGRSSRPDWARHPRDLALLLGAWLRRRELHDVTVVGPGFGGWVAAELATMCPDRLGSLVLVGAAGLLPEEGRILDQVLVSHSQYVQAAFHDPAAYTEVFGDELTDELLVLWDESKEMTARVSWKPYMYNRQMAPLLAELDVSALVVWGEHDDVVPRSCADQYVRALPDARLEVVAGCGHAVDLEQPARLAALVRSHLA